MTSKRRSFSNLRCNEAKLGHTKRKPISLLKPVQRAKRLGYLLLALCLSCTLPETEIAQPGSPSGTEKGLIEILPSNRERAASPIIGGRLRSNDR